MRDAGARVFVVESDPAYVLQASVDNFQVVTIDEVIGEIDVFISVAGNFKRTS